MASLKILVALAIFAIAFPPTLAREWVVGDSRGWTLKFNYTLWAAGKTFVVGDTLVFNYKKGSHNVVKVNGTDFQVCTVPIGAVPLISGHDVIPLATPGKHWYICGFPNHCTLGMKLVITVLPELSPVPSPAPSPSSGKVSPVTSPSSPPSAPTLSAPTPSAPPPSAPTLSADSAPTPSAPSPSAATGIAFSKCHAWFVGVFSILMMIMA